MHLIPVTSSALSEIGWSSEIGLVVRFNGGKIWSYSADKSVFDAIMDAPSKGAAFDRLVKKTHTNGVEITEAELLAVPDDQGPAQQFTQRQRQSRSPMQHLGELLKTNRPSAYF